MVRTHLKNRILVQDCGGVEFQTACNLLAVEDLKRGTHPAEKGGRSKDILEMSSAVPHRVKYMGHSLFRYAESSVCKCRIIL